MLTLTGANGYSAGTTVSGGTLQVNNLVGSGTGPGAVTVASGGTLGGTGIISGAVTVNSGGVLAPGNPFGALTISNNLTLAAGSTNIFEISRLQNPLPFGNPLSCGQANISGALTNGGTLIVTNIGAAALAAGDGFKLFNAAGYSGAFASVVLPPLPVGLAWNTNTLNTSGALSVVATTRTVIGAILISGNSLVFHGAGGVGGANFYLLGATNLAGSLTNWTRLLTNQFDNGGNFNFTNALNPDSPQSFYLLQLP
jgi:autotransporter-associated beta strand protein